MMILSLIFKELKNQKTFALLFVLNASIGLCGFSALEIFKNSLDSSIQKRSKQILGADLGISARRPPTLEERQAVVKEFKEDVEESQVTQTYSMISSGDSSRLVQVKAVEKNYPFYGAIRLKPSENNSNIHDQKKAWIHPELAVDFKMGERLVIGNTQFKIAGIIEDDPTNSMINTLAPRVYISHKYLEDTGLISDQSLAWYSYLYKTPESFSIFSAKESIFLKIKDPAVRVYTHQDHSETMNNLINYLSDFLSLTALCALFLACIGMSFLFRSYFKSKVSEAAVLLSFGLSRAKTFFIYFLQTAFLGLLSFVVSLIFSLAFLPLLKMAAGDLISFDLDLKWSFAFSSGVLALAASLWTALPMIAQMRKVKVSRLLHNSYDLKIDKLGIIIYLLAFFILWGFSSWASHSFKTGSLFAFIFVGCGLVLTGFGGLFLFFIRRLKAKNFLLKWTLRDISRRPAISLSIFVSLSLGMLLLTLIPQVQNNLSYDLRNQESSSDLFLFDIQEDQKEKLKNLMAMNFEEDSVLSSEFVKIDKMLPMISSRLVSVNGESFSKGDGKKKWSREKTREMHFRNRNFNLSYQDGLSPSEQIIKGKMWSDRVQTGKLAGISIEKRFAERLGLKMNNLLNFEVENQKIQGVIQNIRKVNWLSFQPNFFIVFQPGVLENFSKTYLASVRTSSDKTTYQVQKLLAKNFPNVSSVDLSRLTNKFLALSRHITLALELMTLLCLISALAVLYSIVSRESSLRKWDIGLLKVFGASFSHIRWFFVFPFGLICLVAVVLGVLLSFFVSYLISYILFDSHFYVFSPFPFLLLVIVFLISIGVVVWSVGKTLQTKSSVLLSENKSSF